MTVLFLSSILASSGCLEDTDDEIGYEDNNYDNNYYDYQNDNDNTLILIHVHIISFSAPIFLQSVQCTIFCMIICLRWFFN